MTPEIIESPDGDPSKRGTITAAHTIQLSAKDVAVADSPYDGHERAELGLLVATPTRSIVIADKMGKALRDALREG